MPRIQTYLDSEMISRLNEFSKQQNISVSNAISSIVKNYFDTNYTPVPIPHALDRQSKSYFLRILNTLNQVLMCVYDENKTSVNAESAETCIQQITKQIRAFAEMSK